MRPLTWFVRMAFFAGLLTSVGGAVAQPELVLDRSAGAALFGREATRAWHPASLTKIMTAYVALEAVSQGRLSLDSPVVMSRHALSAQPSRLGLPEGTAIRLEDALIVLAVKSANDVAIAVAEAVSGSEEAFVAEMNAASERLGLSGSHWANPHGLHDPTQVTTARDIAMLTDRLIDEHPESAAIFATNAFVIDDTETRSHNGLLGRYPGVDGFKTGYVCASGFNVVVTAEREGREILVVVLGSLSAKERDAHAAHLVEAGFAASPTTIGLEMLEVDERPVTDMRSAVCGGQGDSDESGAEWRRHFAAMPRVLAPPVRIEPIDTRTREPVTVVDSNAEQRPRRF